jgi:hypothetical protein
LGLIFTIFLIYDSKYCVNGKAIKAIKNPMNKRIAEIHKTFFDHFDTVSHADWLPSLGISHIKVVGFFLYTSQKLNPINSAAIENVHSLYRLKVDKKGTFAARPAITAPKPNATKSAGSAQHKRVENDVNNDTILTVFVLKALILFWFLHCILCLQ